MARNRQWCRPRLGGVAVRLMRHVHEAAGGDGHVVGRDGRRVARLEHQDANAFHAVTHEQFDAVVKDLDTSIDAATDDAIVAGFVRLAALVGDAHTSVHVPPNWHRLALQIQPFGDEWRVTRATAATKALLGGKVTSIGGVPIADVVRRLAPLAPQDELAPMQHAIIAANMGTIAMVFSFVPFGTQMGLQFWFLEGALHGAMAHRLKHRR